MICGSCQTVNEAGSQFCEQCGARLALACVSCANPLRDGARFCARCGTPVAADAGDAQQPGAVARPIGAPAAAVPGAAPVSERKLVTVLFADLVGFTPFSEERDAEEVRETLSRYFELAKDVVGRYGGTIEKFIGDAVMAVWGTPTAREDDGERAVRAGLDLVELVPGLGEGLQARAGVLTGEAMVTLGATDQGMVAGDVVNTASRLQSVAAPSTVLVGEATHRTASRAIVFEPAGEQHLKGKTAPVPAWRALRIVAERGGRNRSEALEAPFVGREPELRLLKDLYHSTSRERRARLVSITGVAGVGKSRLAWEFEKYLDGLVETVYWHAGRSPAYGEGITFWALGEMVRARAGLSETDDQETTRAKIAETVRRWAADESEQRWIEAALLALLGAGDPPPGGREVLFAAWRAFFERMASSDIVTMVFQDLHWADAGLLDFIDHLLEWSRELPIFIVTLARPELLEKRPDWGAGKRNFTAISLEPLTDQHMHNLLDGLVPGLPEPTSRAIVSRADGIPLYAVEMVRALVADGRLVESEGVYRPTADLGDVAVPETLQGLIAARLDALEPEDRALVQDAAVLGQSFTPASLASVTSGEQAEIEARLRGLVRKEVLSYKGDARSPERGQYSFVQALFRDVAYNTLAKPERKARHLSAARWFESLGEEELAGALAAHYLAAYNNSPPGPEADALASQARISLRAAGDRAMGLGSHVQALTFYDQALTVSTNLVERVELLQRASHAASGAGRHEQAEKRAQEALEIETSEGNRPGIANATFLLGRTLLNGYRTEQALRLLEDAHRDLADVAGRPEHVALGSQLARAYFFSEQNRQAVEVADAVLEQAEHSSQLPIVADTLVTKGSALCGLGRAYEGIALLRAAHELAESNEFTETRNRALVNLIGFQSSFDPRAAYETAKAAIAQARRTGWSHTTLVVNFASAANTVGEWDEAEAVAAEGLQVEMEGVDWIQIAASLAVLRAMRGEPDEALLKRMRDELDRSDDEYIKLTMIDIDATDAMLAGEYARAREAWLWQAERSALNAPYSLTMAYRVSLWEGNLEAARDAARQLDETGIHGPAIDVLRRAQRAGLHALGGRRAEAAAEYREVMRQLREMGLATEEAVTGVEMVATLGPDDPEAQKGAGRAREIFEQLRAKAMIELLDRVLAAAQSRPDQPPARARRERQGSVAAS